MAQITENHTFDLTGLSVSEILSLHAALSNQQAWYGGLASVFTAIEAVALPILESQREAFDWSKPEADGHNSEEPPF